jgi:TolA-binding protein
LYGAIISDEMGGAMKCHPMRLIPTIVGFSFALGLVGCDYWPPALQAEIEQLRAEIQTLTMETTQLQAQVTDLSKIKQELQGQVDDLSRITREKTGMINSLQNQLDATRARALKAMAPKAPSKPNAKTRPAPKIAPKASANKSRAPKAVGVR